MEAPDVHKIKHGATSARKMSVLKNMAPTLVTNEERLTQKRQRIRTETRILFQMHQ